MLHFALDLVDAINIKSAAFPDGVSSFLGNDTHLRHGIAGMCLDFEPDPVLGFRFPYAGHFFTGIAGYHVFGLAWLF